MSEPAQDRLITGEELFRMGDVGPCELIDGRIRPLTPTSAKHGAIELTLGRHLANYVDANDLGQVLVGEVGICTRRNPDRVRGADIVYLSRAQVAQGMPDGFLKMAPELIVEIISPSDRWQDVREKVDEYFAIGVRAVWIVEPKSRQVLVYSDPTACVKLEAKDTLCGSGDLSAFEMPVAAIFRGV